MKPESLAHRIQTQLHAAANPANASAMSAYMRHIQPFLGARTPQRRKAPKLLR